MAPEPPFLAGAGAKPISSEPESAPGPRTSGAAQKVAAPQHCPLFPIFHTSQHLLNWKTNFIKCFKSKRFPKIIVELYIIFWKSLTEDINLNTVLDSLQHTIMFLKETYYNKIENVQVFSLHNPNIIQPRCETRKKRNSPHIPILEVGMLRRCWQYNDFFITWGKKQCCGAEIIFSAAAPPSSII